MRSFALILTLFVSVFQLNAQEDENYFLLEWGLPDWAEQAVYNWEQYELYKLSDFINPYYFQADYNGDGQSDIAIAIQDRQTAKTGILIIHGGSNEMFLMGAGVNYSNIYDDFYWMDIWKVKKQRTQSVLTFKDDGDIDGNKDIEVKGDVLLVVAAEAASAIIYWDGSKYLAASKSD